MTKTFGVDFTNETNPSGTNTISVYNGSTLVDVALSDLYKVFSAPAIQALLDLISTTQGVILYYNGTDWVALATGTSGQVLKTQGAGANPVWGLPGDLSITSQAQGDILYFNGTNWVRLGAGTSGQFLKTNGTGANPAWADSATSDGWSAGTGTWSYSSADAPTFVISINADVTAIIGVGDRIKLTQTTAKYFIVTAVGAFGGGATLVTVYGGTDYTLANAAISSPYYSHQKVPFGFPTSPAKWTVELSDTSSRAQASPVQNTWYNPGSLSISIPIGQWRVEAIVGIYCSTNGTAMNTFFTLSTANNSESDADFTGFVALSMPSGIYTVYGPLYKAKQLTLASKTSYFLNIRTTNSGVSTIGITGDLTKTFVRAVCAYL